jgi:hypothetical protein
MFPQTKELILKLIETKPIYTITTIREPADKIPAGQPRCVGFYYSKDIAIEAVEHNSCDIYEEGYYPYAVVEEYHQGIYAFPKEVWFKWDKKKKGYVRIKTRPKEFKFMAGFGLG